MSRLQLAYFSPLPPERTGIADYSRELLPYLAEHVDLTLFTDQRQNPHPAVDSRFPIEPLENYAAQRFQYDLPLYQMGNNVAHAALYPLLRRYPGLLVLHDLRLHDLVATLTAGRGDVLGYGREVAYGGGRTALNRLRNVLLENQGVALPAELAGSRAELEALPLSERLVALSLGTVVHSDYVKQHLATRVSNRPLRVIPLLTLQHTARPLRAQLPWPEDALIFASAGFVTPARRLDLVLRAFARLRQELPAARFLIVGGVLGEVDLPALIAELGLQEVVHYAGFAPDVQTLLNWMATADVLVHLRQPTMGETSATVLRALALARPVIVSDHGWYAELPDDACYKVPPAGEAALLQAMRELASSPERREAYGRAAQELVRREHAPGRVAAQYVSFMHELLGR